MVSTQVQLDPQQYERLKRQAEAEHKSVSDKVREAVEVYLSRDKEKVDDLSDLEGKHKLLADADLKEHDRYWPEMPE